MSCDKGTEEMRQIVEKITDKPVVVLITHVDGDHIHCLGQFEEAWMSPSEYARFHNDTGTDFICWIITALISAPAPVEILTCRQILFKSRQFFAWLDHNIYLKRGGLHLQAAGRCRMEASSFKFKSMIQRRKNQA